LKRGKRTALALSIAVSAAIIAGCSSNKPPESYAGTTPPISPSQTLQLPASATPEQRATAQAQDQLGREAGAAMFKMQQERLKNSKK